MGLTEVVVFVHHLENTFVNLSRNKRCFLSKLHKVKRPPESGGLTGSMV